MATYACVLLSTRHLALPPPLITLDSLMVIPCVCVFLCACVRVCASVCNFVFLTSLCSLVEYVSENEGDDPLVNPTEFNPFKEKSKCTLL